MLNDEVAEYDEHANPSRWTCSQVYLSLVYFTYNMHTKYNFNIFIDRLDY